MTVGLGTGGDTVYAMPDASTPITINGGSPTVAPGDQLNLALCECAKLRRQRHARFGERHQQQSPNAELDWLRDWPDASMP